MKSGRAPSYKSIAFAILRNDHNLYSLGFSQRESALVDSLRLKKSKSEDNQMELLF
jgi:predicted phosphoadenosine phosphosulfate sulfurtransferase